MVPPLSPNFRELAEWLAASGVPFLPVLTKRDKVSNNKLQIQLRKTRQSLQLPIDEPILTYSTLKRQGRDELLELIRELLEE